ncbi:MAG: VWA domain-containing protein [Vicinamibacterales bacterium]|nr:VWA domain-containing protein [Vicinamibacterales bacterium]
MPKHLLLAALALCLAVPHGAVAQGPNGAKPADPMRIAIIVDNSQPTTDHLPQIRCALQELLKALPPGHELMLVTSGGQMNIRVQPTKDYLEILEAAGEISVARGGGNALIGSVQEVYDRFFRTLERRWPVIIISTDGADFSQRVTTKSVNELLQALKQKDVRVNAMLLTSTGDGLVRSVTLAMIEQTGGFYESATIATALPGRTKALAGKITKQYTDLQDR